MVNSPIEITLDKINEVYQPGTLPWMKKKRPKEWRRMTILEREINRAAFQGDEEGLTKVLNEYEDFILEMIQMFKTPTEETRSLFLEVQR